MAVTRSGKHRDIEMIKVFKAKKESRKRDIARERIILKIGNKPLHLTRNEAFQLAIELVNIL